MITPRTISFFSDSAPLEAAISELSKLTIDAPDAFVERLLSIGDRFTDLVCLDGNSLAATAANEITVVVKPSDVMDAILATARAGDFDLSVFDFLRHDSVSVGCCGDSNEGPEPGESQGSSGDRDRNSQPVISRSETSA